MERKEQNYIRQLLLELEDYLFSLSWYDGEDRLKTFRDVSDIKSIFQLVPKRYLKLLEGKIYTQEELDRAREEGFTRDELRVLQILLEESNDWQEEKIFTLFDGDITTEVLEKIKSKLKNNK